MNDELPFSQNSGFSERSSKDFPNCRMLSSARKVRLAMEDELCSRQYAILLEVPDANGSCNKSVRILIVDDHEMVREGLRRLIEGQPGWEVCGTARTGREAVKQAENLDPDVVVLDMSLPGSTALEAVRQIKRTHPQTEVLIFTGHEMDELIPEIFEAGAKSFILKSDASSELIEAIASLSRHKPFFTKKVSDKLFSRLVERSDQKGKVNRKSDRLTTREREIVQLLAEGKSNKEVASKLGIGLRTVETHRASALLKLGVRSLAGLVRYAVRKGMVKS
jgi:two-component system response regulator NreC